MNIHFTITDCSLGKIIIAATEQGICLLEFGKNEKALKQRVSHFFPKAEIVKPPAGFTTLVKKIVSYIERPRGSLNVPIDLHGTTFQQKVWRELLKIPCGATTSYLAIATAIRQPTAMRAVGQAVGSNPVSILVPCHRVLRHDGSIGGYAWGLERKRELLSREGYSSQKIAA